MGYDAPNYTQTPNAFFDALPDLSEAELRIGLAVIRKTFGWHKRSDKISLTQFQELTGMSRQGVLNGVNGLIDKEVMARQEDGDSFKYALVVNEVDQGSQRGRPPLVNEVDTQKKPLKKVSTATAREARDRFDFLPERDRKHLEYIVHADEKYQAWPDKYFGKVLGYNCGGIAEPMEMIREHGWPKVCAALTIAGLKKNTKHASWAFFEGILNQINNPEPKARIHRHPASGKAGSEPQEGTRYSREEMQALKNAGFPYGWARVADGRHKLDKNWQYFEKRAEREQARRAVNE